MARDRANINTGIWNDADYRHLSPAAQWLYFLLMTHPTLTYVGVADWRPKRITPFAAGLTAGFIEDAAAELSAGRYIVIDEDTEEVLVRSFVKHDGILKQPRLAVSMANAYAQTASNSIRGVVVHELRKQREAHPEYACWADKRVADILSQPSVSPNDLPTVGDGFTPGFGDGFGPNLTPGFGPTEGMPTSTSTATTTPSSTEEGESEGKSRKRSSAGTRISDDFTIDDEMRAWAAENTPHVDIDWHTQKFIDHFASQSGQRGVKTQWGRTWKNWMRTEEERAPANRQQQRPNRDAASARGLVQAHEDLFGRTT